MSKSKILLPLIFSIIFIVLINAIGSFLHFRLDLTTEKRHTLSIATEEILTDLDDIIYIKGSRSMKMEDIIKGLQS